MFRNTWCAMALAVAIFPAYGQDAREELKQLQQRIQQLEKRLQETENVAAQASARPAGENAFNPAVSVILQGTAARSSLDPNTYRITGFAPPTGEIGPARDRKSTRLNSSHSQISYAVFCLKKKKTTHTTHTTGDHL